MATRAPFTARIKLYPRLVSKRTERIRELDRLAYHVGEAVRANPAVWTAQPGGGPDGAAAIALDSPGVNTVAVKPQFGTAVADQPLRVNANSGTKLPYREDSDDPTVRVVPAQATVVGYYDPNAVSASEEADSTLRDQPQPTHQVFSGGKVHAGNRNVPWAANPTARVAGEVKALKATLEQSLSERLPAGTEFEVCRIDYAGVSWGDGGHHFPS